MNQEDVPTTSSAVAILDRNSQNEVVTTQIQRNDTTARVQNALSITDGNFQNASLGNTITVNHNYGMVNSEEPTRKKRKILQSSDQPGFQHLGADIFVNLDAPITPRSRVFEGEKRSEALGHERIAVKLLAINTKEEAKPLKDEAFAIRDNPHKNIVRYIAADFNTDKFMNMYLAMEMCNVTNLHDRVMQMRRNSRKFTFADCMSIAKQLSSGLSFMHENNILHRDIKPSNVLFSRDGKVLKLTDFSLAKPVRPGRSVTADSFKRIGTDGWRAPEVYARNNHGKKADVFSLGLLFYFVWSNGEQAYGSDPDITNFNIKTNRNRDLSKIRFPHAEEARNLLKKMLDYDEERRVSASTVKSHPLCKDAKKEIENQEGEIYRIPAAGAVEEPTVVTGHCIVVFDRRTSMMHAFKPSTKTWGHLQTLSAEMTSWNMTVVRAGEYIYALSETRRVFGIKYTDPNAVWETEDDMLLEHGGLPTSTVLGGYIYAIGGSQWSSKLSKEGERFDLETREWSRIPDMETRRKVHSVIACRGHVYSIGGREDSTKSVSGETEGAEVRGEKFNPTTDKWSPIAPMNKARHAASAATLENKIYILGGWRGGNRLSEAESYNTEADEWTVIRSMNIPRSYLSAVEVQGKIYAVNGDSGSPLTIEEYDPTQDRWEIADRMENMTIWACASAAVYLPLPQ